LGYNTRETKTPPKGHYSVIFTRIAYG